MRDRASRGKELLAEKGDILGDGKQGEDGLV